MREKNRERRGGEPRRAGSTRDRRGEIRDPEGSTRQGLDHSGRNSRGIRLPEGGERGRLEELLEDLKNELEKRQAKKDPEISPREEKKQQLDVKSSSRCGRVPFHLPSAPEDRLCHSWRSGALREPLRQLQADVTLDPDTAHPDLELSPDGKRVWRGAGHRPPPACPERFDHWPFVLGHQRFTSGRHRWAVDVGDSGDWAVGVARDSVRRKGRLSLGPPGGIWGLEKWGGQLRALTPLRVTPLVTRGLPRRVSVHLDCSGGSVAFFDAEGGGLLFAFSRVPFAGEGLRPWFWVVGARSQLRLCP